MFMYWQAESFVEGRKETETKDRQHNSIYGLVFNLRNIEVEQQ